MSTRMLFPFDLVPKGSRVILYGAGIKGRRFIEQNREVHWCEILYAVDRKHDSIRDFPIPVRSRESLLEAGQSFDFIVIALGAEAYQEEAYDYLRELGIPDEKIITKMKFSLWRDAAEDLVLLPSDSADGRNLRIAFSVSAAIGDQIIFLRLYQEYAKLCPKAEMDIYVGQMRQAEAVFNGQPCLRRIDPGDIRREDYDKYDIVLHEMYGLQVLAYRREKVRRISPEISRSIEAIINYQKKYSADNSVAEFGSRIMIDRARLLGMNRYEIMGMQSGLDFTDPRVKIEIDPSYEEEYHKLGFQKPFITFNCGAGKASADDRPQIKTWPFDHYEKLIPMIKKRFSGIQVVQLGDGRTERVKDADLVMFGKSLEVVKYILRDSLLHIDNESGLPHLATQLGTKCVVLFGPTPVWFWGYPQNINIVSEECKECQAMIRDWYVKCLRYDEPKCMRSITPERVFAEVAGYLEEQG